MELAERSIEFRFKQARPGVKTSHVYLAPYGTDFKGNSKELLLNKYFSKPLKQEVVDIIVNKTHTYVSFAETEKGRTAASACIENLMTCLKPDLLPRKLKMSIFCEVLQVTRIFYSSSQVRCVVFQQKQ